MVKVRGKGTHGKQALQRKQNLLRRCFWVTLKVRLATKVRFFIKKNTLTFE